MSNGKQIVTIPNQHEQIIKEILPYLLVAKFDAPPIGVDRLVLMRYLPGRRSTYQLQIGNDIYLIKTFFHTNKKDKDTELEQKGSALLNQHKLNSPKILSSIHAKGAQILVYEWLESGDALLELAFNDQVAFKDAFNALLIQLIKSFEAGVIQNDMHLGNFFYDGKVVYWLDTGSIDKVNVTKATIQSHLSLLLAQVPLALLDWAFEKILLAFAESYRLDQASLKRSMHEQKHLRAMRYAKKLLRNCTEVVFTNELKHRYATRRDFADHASALIEQLDDLMISGVMLKNGRSQTVAKVTFAGRDLVIKRYNVTSVFKWLKRLALPSRAQHVWQASHMLLQEGVLTPKPYLFVERKVFGLFKTTAYVVHEWQAGTNLTHLHEAGESFDVDVLDEVLQGLLSGWISHGDFKAMNFLWLKDSKRISLIDLDSIVFHSSKQSFKKAFQKDLMRFARNALADDKINHILQDKQHKLSKL